MGWRRLPVVALTAGLALATTNLAAQEDDDVADTQEPAATILLRGLDKVTAGVSPIEAHIGQPVRFGSLEITVRDCQKAPPEEPPESAAFLEIREVRAGESPIELFSGWMLASSPAFSTLEHPVYDVWVIDCEARASISSAE